jgi:UDP-N-acetyl-D-galactosamine dehydrogenase
VPTEKFDAIVLTVAHNQFLEMELKKMLKPEGILYDVKGILKKDVDGRL